MLNLTSVTISQNISFNNQRSHSHFAALIILGTMSRSTKVDPFDISNFRSNNEPALIRAARVFQDNIKQRDSKIQAATEKNNNLEKELADLQSKMDSKMTELNDLQELAEKTKPAAHILETVMGELEQRNLELSSLLKASEKSRSEMEQILKDQNEELTTLRANTVIMRTLEEEIGSLNEKKHELVAHIHTLEEALTDTRRQEQDFHHRINEIEMERDQAITQYDGKAQDLLMKIAFAEEQIKDKDQAMEKTELTVKELFEKCSQLGANNSEMKSELLHCLESAKRLKDINTKLQFCKDYLEQQVDHLIRELKATKGSNEQLKLEISNITREKQNSNKQVMLLEEQEKQHQSEMKLLKDKLTNMHKYLQEYESGEIRSAACITEMKREKDAHENTKLVLEKKIREMEAEIKQQESELKNAGLTSRKLKTELVQMQSKIEYYQQHFIEKQELQKIKSDLEIKYKLDLNTQLQRVSSMFEQEQNELISSMREALAQQRQESHDYDSSSPLHTMTYRTHV